MIVTERLHPHVFRLPIEKIRAGYKSDIYFARTKLILEADGRRDRVTMQIFQKHPDAVVVGTDQTLALLHVGAGRYRDARRADALFERYLVAERRMYETWLALPRIAWEGYEPIAREVFEISRELASLWEPAWQDLRVTSLVDGEVAQPGEPVMHIEGEYAAFSHLETLYLGALSEGTRVATNTRDVVAAARGKPVIMFGARHQGHEAQASSGYAAYVGGAIGVSTDEQGEWWGSRGLGTVPHALIAVYGGDTTVATLKFDEYINRAPESVGHLTAKGTPEGHVNVTALVDFQNDVVNTSLGVAHASASASGGCASTRPRRSSTRRCSISCASRTASPGAPTCAASRRSSCRSYAPRSMTPATATCASSPRAASTRRRSGASKRSASRSTCTASALRWCTAKASTTPPTSSA